MLLCACSEDGEEIWNHEEEMARKIVTEQRKAPIGKMPPPPTRNLPKGAWKAALAMLTPTIASTLPESAQDAALSKTESPTIADYLVEATEIFEPCGPEMTRRVRRTLEGHDRKHGETVVQFLRRWILTFECVLGIECIGKGDIKLYPQVLRGLFADANEETRTRIHYGAFIKPLDQDVDQEDIIELLKELVQIASRMPIEKEPVAMMAERKTAVCFEYRDKGTCSWGEKCKFAHEKAKGQEKDTKKAPCRFFASGHCQKGNECSFAHVARASNEEPERALGEREKAMVFSALTSNDNGRMILDSGATDIIVSCGRPTDEELENVRTANGSCWGQRVLATTPFGEMKAIKIEGSPSLFH